MGASVEMDMNSAIFVPSDRVAWVFSMKTVLVSCSPRTTGEFFTKELAVPVDHDGVISEKSRTSCGECVEERGIEHRLRKGDEGHHQQ